MKQILFYLFFGGAIVAGLSSCLKERSFLDKTVTTDLNEESVFSDSANTMDFLTGLYTEMAFSFDPIRFGGRSGGAGLNACSDESYGGGMSRSLQYLLWTTGTVNAANVTDDAWVICYRNIRRANLLMKHLPDVPFPVLQQDAVREEARFLRAWYYFILLKTYGGIPLIGETIYNSTDEINAARNTFEQCVDYIVSECDKAANSGFLPDDQGMIYYGHVTRGASLALKARVLLYAASPLFNGGGPSGDLLTTDPALMSIVGYTAYDKERWKMAADAARDVMDMGLYSLFVNNNPIPGEGFREVFLKRVNDEYILPFMQITNADLEWTFASPTRGGAGSGAPTQGFVDAFTMKNGLPISDPSSGYDPGNPYKDRDPRFENSVTHNGSLMVTQLSNGTLSPVYTYYKFEPDGFGTGKGTKSGYYVQKMTDRYTIHNDIFTSTERCLPLIRYAEIMLNYAEAINEYTGPTQEVYEQLTAIRERAGIEPGPDELYGLKANMTQEEMRNAIWAERRIELSFEEHRFWDVRRWKIAEQTDNGPVYGMKIEPQGGGAYSYTPVLLETRVFRKEMYLWPISRGELGKSVELLQNPGY